jgi:hypothetical protein
VDDQAWFILPDVDKGVWFVRRQFNREASLNERRLEIPRAGLSHVITH